jgi:hypothetical protein
VTFVAGFPSTLISVILTMKGNLSWLWFAVGVACIAGAVAIGQFW